MRKLPPYIIEHIDLSKTINELSFPLHHEAGYYCVFWWKDIALGHLYIECKQVLSSKELHQKIIKAIEPAVDSYISQNHTVQGNYKDAFLKKNNEIFTKIMDEIFKNYLHLVLPDKVAISVVICTRNRSKDLQRCLELLQNQRCLPEEIIVVDNAPTDDSTRKITEQYKDVQYIIEQKPGLSNARNTGIKAANKTIIAWIDDDVSVHPLWSYRVWKTFQNLNIAVMTGLVIASSLETESQQIFEKHWSFNRGYEDIIYDKSYYEKNLSAGVKVWEIGAGANMAFRSSVFNEVGYFDERLGAGASGCNEDSELWYRALAKGLIIHYNPRAVVYHEHRKNLRALHKQIFYYMRGFIVASLIQQTQNEQAGYRKHLYYLLTGYYFRLFKSGFPNYSFRYRTLITELRGIAAGILFYKRKKNRPSYTHH